MKYPKLITIALLLFSIFVTACGDDRNSITVKNWGILYKPDCSIDCVSEVENWRPVKIPSSFKVPNPCVHDFQYVWLRGTFNIEGDPGKYYGLSTGRIKYSDDIYVNKRFIGRVPSCKVNWAPLPRNYKIPGGTLRSGKNTVHIKLGIYGNYFGGILGNVKVQPEEEFDRTQFISSLKYKQLPVGIVVFFIALSITLFMTYLSDRKEKLYLLGTSAVLLCVLYIYIPLSSYRIVGYELMSALQFSLTPIFSVLLLLLIQAIYRIYLSGINWIIALLMSFYIVVIVITRYATNDNACSYIVVVLTVLTSIPFFITIMRRLHSKNPDKFLFTIVILIYGTALFIMIYETYLASTGGLISELISTFVPLTFIFLGFIASSREIKKRKKELDNVYERLTKLEGKEISITDTLEVKLKRVLGFIKENYTSDLSREGLAAAVGIHPNYFGRLFKSYTGKTINEYINSLRIGDAVEQLKKDEIKIIDIAFSVGYESLVTFNRVFKKVTGKTPSEYRENI